MKIRLESFVRPRAYGRAIRDGAFTRRRSGQAVLDDALRARAFIGPPCLYVIWALEAESDVFEAQLSLGSQSIQGGDEAASSLLPDGEVEAVAEPVRRGGGEADVVCLSGRPLPDAEQARCAPVATG
jgi:hypothetical protein